MLRRKFIVLNAYIRKISNQSSKLFSKKLEKEEQNKPKRSRWQGIKKIRTEKQKRKINKPKSWVFKKINKIDDALARLTKKKEEFLDIENLTKEYYEQPMYNIPHLR